MTVTVLECATCKRLDRSELGRYVKRCEAFPDGIPDEILFGDRQHRDPFPGDQGLLYEPDPAFAP